MVPLYKPYISPDLPELDAIIHSGSLSYGKWGREFESKLKCFIGNDRLLTTNSYSSAIQIALTVLGLESGDEVIASPMSCLASNMPLLTYGLKVVWADVDPKTGTLSPDSVKDKITDRTKLIFHNHFCGYIGYVDEINTIAREYGLFVIDDCVEAFGSKYKGRLAGNLGTDISLFSFQTVRLPNTVDGGAIAFNDEMIYEKALLMRDFGIRRNIFRDSDGEISKDCDIFLKGYGATMSEVNSYIGCVAMDDITALLLKQKEQATRWFDYFGNDIVTLKRDDVEPNYWVFGLIRDDKLSFLRSMKEKGFYASGVHLPNSYYSVFGKQGYFPNVESFNKKFVAIPCGWWM